MLFITGDRGFQAAVVVFGLLAGYGFRACTGDRFVLVSTHCSFQILANGVGHVFRSVVDDILGIIGDGALLGGVGDVRFCLFRTGQNIAVAILNFLENLLQVLGDVRFVVIFSILAGNYRAGFAGSLGSHVGLIPVFYRIHHAVLLVCPLAHGAFCIHRRIVPGIRKFLTDAVGSNGALADRIIIFRPCVAAVFVESRCTGFGFPCRRIQLQIHGLCLAAVDGGVVVFIQFAGQGLGIEFAFYRKVTFHIQVAADSSIASSSQSTGLHCSCSLNSTRAYIQSGAGNLAAFDVAGTYIQALTGNIAGYSQIATYGSIVIYSERIGSCIAGVGNAIGCQGSAYRGISSGRQGAEGTCGTVDGSACNSAAVDVSALGIQAGAGNGITLNISCRNDIMDIDVAGCRQISILEGSYTVCQFISGDSTAACIDITAFGTKCSTLGIDVSATSPNKTAIGFNVTVADGSFAIGQGLAGYRSVAHGSTLTIGYCFTGDGCLGSDISVFIYGEGPVGPFDAAITHKSCSCLIIVVTASSEPFCVHLGTGSTYCYAFAVNLNLIGCTLIKNQGRSRFFGSGHLSGRRNLSFSLLEYIIIIQAQSAISGFHQFGIRCPGEVRAHKGCCHQHGCGQFLQSLSCGFALGVAFGNFRCHHIGVLRFTPDDFVNLIHGVTLL